MHYYSTNNTSVQVDFREATLQGQPADKGLFFPHTIPQLPKGFMESLDQLNKVEIGMQVIRPFVGNTIPDNILEKMVAETIYFDFPLIPVTDSISALELFHGPTLAFKDVGARFMSRCLDYFTGDRSHKITVLVATSGDTGGAVAHAFYGMKNVEVVILYPSGKVSSIQEMQLTTLGQNVRALEVKGTFDDCQQMVKQAFHDKDLQAKLHLTSANSINVARWLPQQFYYFFAFQQWENKKAPPVVSVPSGNFGNICAGLMAFRGGLPVRHFIAACNANDVVLRFFKNGRYEPHPSFTTISNAMDVGDPSNFIRVLHLFGKDASSLKKIMTSYSISEEATRDTIKTLYHQYGYLPDPHGAVGFRALELYLRDHPEQKGYFLETAHPVKFYDVVEPVIEGKVELPTAIQDVLLKTKQMIHMPAGFAHLKSYLLDNAGIR